MSRRYYSNNAPTQNLSSSITNSATSLTVTSFLGWPTQFPFFATLELGTANEEIISVTGITGAVATVVRAQDGSTAISHNAGATLDFTVVRQDFDEANSHINSSTGVHGISGSVVGTTDAQILSSKTLASPTVTGTSSGQNETLSGTLSVSGTTTLSGAVTASAAGTGLAVTNNATVGGTMTVTGASTAASFAASGNGQVSGVIKPTQYANEAAAGTATAGLAVWLTAPTTTGYQPGLYVGNGTIWVPVGPNDTGWITATLGSSWVSYDGGTTYQIPQYRLLNGWVSVEGSMKSGTTGTTVFTLPAGMRPSKTLQVLCVSVTGTATLAVAPTGAVSVVNYTTGGSNTTISMNFSFPADQ